MLEITVLGEVNLRKKNLLNRFERLSKPSGRPQWTQAVKALILMIVAGVIGTSLGLKNGIEAIMLITLLATLIIDISLPIKKVAILAFLGFLMTTLAFLSASTALLSLPFFIFITVMWAFFSISMYIFGSMEGTLGFSFFLTYFVAVLLVNPTSTTLEWISYSTLAYLVASILFIPKLWIEKKRIRQLVTVGFKPESTIQNVIYNMKILSGISLNSNNYRFFKFGGFLKILRNYGDLLTSRISPVEKKYWMNYLDQTDKLSMKIGENFEYERGPVDQKDLDSHLSMIMAFDGKQDINATALLLSKTIQNILLYCNSLLTCEPGKKFKAIQTKEKTFKEVINANFNLKNLYIRHAIRFTLAMTIGLIFIYLTRERSAIWITMGILIIIKPDITSTVDSLIQRVSFNFLAIILAISLAFIFPHYVLVWFAVVMLFLFRAFYPTYMGLSVMAMTVFIVLVWPTGTVYDNAIARIVDILIGGIIAFICAYVILPSRVTVNIPELFSKTVTANAKYLKHIMVSSPSNFSKTEVSKCLTNYILQESNFEAGIKKLEDTFRDINEDLSLYQDMLSANTKLAADLTAVAAIFNETPEKISNKKSEIQNIREYLVKLENPTETAISEVSDIDLKVYNNKSDELSQLLNWVYTDIQIISQGLEIADEARLFERYTLLS